MDFLKALEKAKELGLSKVEFLPIYMNEIKNKTDQLACQNTGLTSSGCSFSRQSPKKTEFAWGWGSWTDDKASQEVWSPASLSQSTWPERTPLNGDAQKRSEHADFDLHDLKAYLDSMKESLCAQLQEFKRGNTLDCEQFKAAQQDMKYFFTQIHSDLQTLLPSSQDGGSQKQDKNETASEMFNRILQKLNECILETKQNIEHSQVEIVTEMYCMQSNLKDDYHKQVNRQDELFLLQGIQMKENYNNGQLAVLQCQNQLATYIKELQSFAVGTFSKISEFQNIFGATMQKQTNTQQLLLKNTADICTALTENSNLFQKFKADYQEIQPENQKQNFSLPVDVGADEARYDGTCEGVDAVVRGSALADKDPASLLDNKIISVYESSAPCNGCIISVIYDFCIQNVSLFLESRKDFQKVTYDEKLGCCLRASLYFSEDKETENILTVCLDVCQVGRDVVLPDLLRILSELTLINRGSNFSFWNVAKEKGVFYLPKLRGNGWFEVCAVYLDFHSAQFKDFVGSGTLSFYYNITVFNREAERTPERHSHLSCDLTDHGDDSYDSDSEYFDADAEENEETTRERKSTSESSASTCVLEESVPQPMVEYESQDQFTVQPPCSTYFLPVSALNALVGSESIVDGQDWYLHFLGHNVHAVLTFLDDDTMVISIDHFHGDCCADLPEFAAYRCRVSLVDQTDQMQDLEIADTLLVFDLTADKAADWIDNCVCVFRCRNIESRFKNNGRIILQFDFFDMS